MVIKIIIHQFIDHKGYLGDNQISPWVILTRPNDAEMIDSMIDSTLEESYMIHIGVDRQ